jgi:UDP-N-acetyl-D-glucosamine dehydrogenase
LFADCSLWDFRLSRIIIEVRFVRDWARKIKEKQITVGVLGLAYKKDIDDLRESPSIELIELLRQKGARVDYNDPYIPRTHKQRRHNLRMASKKLSAIMLAGYDVVLISTDHSDYDYNWIVKNAKLVVDARNATAVVRGAGKKVIKA